MERFSDIEEVLLERSQQWLTETGALVIELACLSVAHLKLLDIARNKGVELFGVGQLPTAMTSDDLSGVRLISLTDLPEAIAAIHGPRVNEKSVPMPAAIRHSPIHTLTKGRPGRTR